MNDEIDIVQPQIAAGLRAGGIDAIRKARMTGTKLVIWRNGKIEEITADEAELMLQQQDEGKTPS